MLRIFRDNFFHLDFLLCDSSVYHLLHPRFFRIYSSRQKRGHTKRMGRQKFESDKSIEKLQEGTIWRVG